MRSLRNLGVGLGALLAAWLLCGVQLWAAITTVGTPVTGGGTGSATTTVTSTTMAVTAGNLLVVGVGHASPTVTITGVTDTAGNTYLHDASCLRQSTYTSDTWYARNVTGHATNTVTAALSAAATFRGIVVAQYAGADLTNAFELCTVFTGGASPATSPSFSPAAAGNLNTFFYLGSGNGTSFTEGSGYVIQATFPSPQIFYQDRVSAPSGAQTAAISWTGASNTAEVSVASFRQAGAAPSNTRRTLVGVGR